MVIRMAGLVVASGPWALVWSAATHDFRYFEDLKRRMLGERVVNATADLLLNSPTRFLSNQVDA